MATPLFELTKVLSHEAKEIIDARDKAFAIHHTGDIDAAGDEIEKTVRNVLRRKIPLDYYVGHGHIVDEKLSYNGQYDIIIADNSGSPILFRTENETEYFPFESLFAVGEVKSTYAYSKNHIQHFISKTQNLYITLSREQTRPNQLTKDVSLGGGGDVTISRNDSRPYQNPIFKFMFFVDGGDFNFEKLGDLFKNTIDQFLPNVICILDKGVIVKSLIEDQGAGPMIKSVELFPEFIQHEKAQDYKWTFLELGNNSDPLAAHLAFVIFALNQHLRNCLVLRPNLLKYFENLFKIKQGTIVTFA